MAYGDTLLIEAQVSRHQGNPTLTVMEGNTVHSLPWRRINHQGDRHFFELYHTDRYLPSGTYQLRVQATHGENTGSDYQEINLQELPLEEVGMALLTRSGQQYRLMMYDTAGLSAAHVLQGDPSYMAANHRQQRLVVAPETLGRLQGFFYHGTEAFKLAAPAPPGNPQYSGMVYSEGGTYAFESFWQVRVLNAQGAVGGQYPWKDGAELTALSLDEPGLLACLRPAGQSLHLLELLRPLNGALLRQAALSAPVVDMAYLGQGRYGLLINESGGAAVKLFNSERGTITDFAGVSGVEGRNMVLLPNGRLAFSTDEGVYFCSPDLGELPQKAYTFAPEYMEVDRLSGQLIFAVGSALQQADPGQPAQLLHTAADSIANFRILYNK